MKQVLKGVGANMPENVWNSKMEEQVRLQYQHLSTLNWSEYFQGEINVCFPLESLHTFRHLIGISDVP